MARKIPRRVVWTSRDDDIATFLFRTPAVAEQLKTVSQTWKQPFFSVDRTYHRLRELCQAGWLSRSPLAIASQVGSRCYYQLTLKGFRMWHRDPQRLPPTKRFFAPVSDALHHHLCAKAQFLTHLTVVAHQRGFRIERDKPENTFEVKAVQQSIRPDHYLELVGPYGRRFARFFEFDRSTETQESKNTLLNTWAQKNLVYNAYQDICGRQNRFRVVPVTTESRMRLENILRLFGQQTTIQNRQLYVGVYLPDFLAEDDALCHPIFADHRREHVPLIPTSAIGLPPLGDARTARTRRPKRSPVNRGHKLKDRTRNSSDSRARRWNHYDPMPVLQSIGWATRTQLAPHVQMRIPTRWESATSSL